MYKFCVKIWVLQIYLTKICDTQYNSCCHVCMCFLADLNGGLLETVERELTGDGNVKERQLILLKAITGDISEPSKQLIAKLNCESKCESFVSNVTCCLLLSISDC